MGEGCDFAITPTRSFRASASRESLTQGVRRIVTNAAKPPRGFDGIGDPYGNRTRVSAVKGPRPGPLDEGAIPIHRRIVRQPEKLARARLR